MSWAFIVLAVALLLKEETDTTNALTFLCLAGSAANRWAYEYNDYIFGDDV